jgi:hypothetical protein
MVARGRLRGSRKGRRRRRGISLTRWKRDYDRLPPKLRRQLDRATQRQRDVGYLEGRGASIFELRRAQAGADRAYTRYLHDGGTVLGEVGVSLMAPVVRSQVGGRRPAARPSARSSSTSADDPGSSDRSQPAPFVGVGV